MSKGYIWLYICSAQEINVPRNSGGDFSGSIHTKVISALLASIIVMEKKKLLKKWVKC
jgi:hypothetical protein